MLVVTACSSQIDFLAEQKKFVRVREAFADKEELVTKTLSELSLSVNDLNILFIAYKDSDELELYVKSKSETAYRLAATYTICSRSGTLGPKRKQGDYQVPEGFYYVDRFNPSSSFHLSLGLNYPNSADRKKSTAVNLGGDIFIHGSCVTIGCLPMTDDKIKELYLYAIHAKNNGQSKIPVYVFPFRMSDENFEGYRSKYKEDTELISFWNNLKTGYDLFVKKHSELHFKFAENGDYLFQ